MSYNENLIKRLSAEFENRFGQKANYYFAPGRINLIGEHTDYNNGFVLPAAIDKAIYFEVAKNNSNTFRFYSIDYDEYIEIDAGKLEKSSCLWANYLIGVAAQFRKKALNPNGLDVVFGGDIPLGAGLSSSAALECGFAICLNEEFGFGVKNEELILMAQKAEHEFAGVMCGIMDQFASTFGKEGQVMKLDCRSMEFDYFPLTNEEVDIVLCDTKVKHSLASSEYNIRRAECEKGVAILKQQFPAVNSLRDADPMMLESVKEQMEENVYDRCHYVIHEEVRVDNACKALLKNDFKSFGKLMYETHDGLSMEYEVSCNELDILVDIARSDKAVLGARMMGGGFGGCTINLIEKGSTEHFIERIKKEYLNRTGTDTEIYKVAISDGAGKLKHSRT